MNVQFTLSLNDLASSGIRSVAATALDALKDVNRSIGTTNKMLADLGKTAAHAMKNIGTNVADAKGRIEGMGKTVADLKDGFSQSATSAASAMKQIGDAANDAAGRVSALTKATDGMGKSSGGEKSVGKVRAMWNKIKKISTDEGKDIGLKSVLIAGQVFKAVGTGYYNLVSFGAKQAWGAIKSGAMPFAKSTISSGLAGVAMKDGYKSKAGDKQGGALYEDVGNYARGTMYGPELHQTAKGMLDLGMNAAQVMPAMRMLGEVAGGNQEKLDMLSVAFAKTATSGKLTREQFEQFKSVGFDPLENIAQKSGAKYADLQRQMDAGGISSGMVNSSLADATSGGGKFDGSLAKAAQSPQGMMQGLQNTIEQAQIEFGVALAPAIGQLLTVLQPVIDHLPVIFNALQPIVENLFMRLGEIMPSILDLADAVFTLIKPILDLLVSPEIAQFVQHLIDFSAVLAKVLTPVIKLIAWIIGKVVGMINAAFEWVRKKFGMFMKNNPGVGEGLSKISEGIDNLTGSKDPDLQRKPGIAKAATAAPATVSTGAGNWKMPPPGSTAKPNAGPITGGGQKIVRINFRSVVEKMYNTVADTTGLVSTIEPRLDEAINRILAGVS